MKAAREFGAELLGLFVEDWQFAAAIASWVAAIAVASRTAIPGSWLGPLLFAGLSIVLLANVAKNSRRKL
jgi:hypothetical protein